MDELKKTTLTCGPIPPNMGKWYGEHIRSFRFASEEHRGVYTAMNTDFTKSLLLEERMTLNHVAITVTDTISARNFLEKYVGLQGIGKNNTNMTHVHDDNGLILSLFKGEKITEPQTTHIGFMQDSQAKVDEIYQRLKEDGFKMEPPQHSHGYTFYVIAPSSFMVEVVC
jgi:lactoylglutathione lyase